MGKKGKWLSSLKRAFISESKEKKKQKSKEKEKENVRLDPTGSNTATLQSVKLSPPPNTEEIELIEPKVEHGKQTYLVGVPTVFDNVFSPAGPAGPAQVAVEVIRRQLATNAWFAGKSMEEVAAIRIQTAFRAYLAKRAVFALRGLVRLKLVMEGSSVKRQAAGALRCIQALSRVQCQIHARRIRMIEENQAVQKQLLQKHAKELVNLQMGEDWDDNVQSKQQIEASLLHKHKAAIRRERAMAYSFTHQQTWKNVSRSINPLFMDQKNPSWGWSWMERWMAAWPWEGRGDTIEKEQSNGRSSVKSAGSNFGEEISKAFARYQLNLDKESLKANQKPSRTPSLLSLSTPKSASIPPRKLKSASPRSGVGGPDNIKRRIVCMQSKRNLRHSIAGSLARDNESLANSQSLPSYTVPTKSARAKTRLQSPMGLEANGTPEKEPIASARKRLSYPPSPAKPRWYSGPPKLDSSITNTEVAVVNSGSS